MLTRHLYRYDEVKASLLYCIITKRHEEAFFWCMELLDSFGGSDVLEVLVKAWILCIGWTGFGFLRHFQEEEFDEDALYNLLTTLIQYKERDATVYGLLFKGALVKSQIDTVVPIPEVEWLSEFSEHEQYIWRAIKEKKVLLAWSMLHRRWSWELLEKTAEPYQKEIFQTIKGSELFSEYEWERKVLILLCLCSDKKAFQKIDLKEIPKPILQKKEEWAVLEGKRKRRIFKIPTEAILWGTRRSLEPNTQTNEGELLTILPTLANSPYWEEVAKSMGSWKHIRKVDEMKEAFYDMYFPDDIPDEWSRKDREYSHGYGMLINGNKTIQQFKGWRSLLSRMPTLGLQSTTSDALKNYNWEWQTFEEAYNNRPEIEWKYIVKKKKIVIKK
jgi:hypothetical protein